MLEWLRRKLGRGHRREGTPGETEADASDEAGEAAPPDPPPMTEVLDLHGFFPEQAEEVVAEFLRAAVEEGRCEVRIAHGKGRSVMKAHVLAILARDPRVEAFGDAPPERGGWGSTVVRLRGPRT